MSKFDDKLAIKRQQEISEEWHILKLKLLSFLTSNIISIVLFSLSITATFLIAFIYLKACKSLSYWQALWKCFKYFFTVISFSLIRDVIKDKLKNK